MKLKIYIVGFMSCLSPERIPEEHKVQGKDYIAAIVHHVGMTLAFSREEARAWGIEMAKKEMPESGRTADLLSPLRHTKRTAPR